MQVHRELNGFGESTVTKEKQITMQDLKNKEHQDIDGTVICTYFDYAVYIDVGKNELIEQRFHFKRVDEKVWQVTCLIGNGEQLGDMPMRIVYEVPKRDFDLVKIAAMGLLYIKLTLQERVGFYESLNYELLEVTNGI